LVLDLNYRPVIVNYLNYRTYPCLIVLQDCVWPKGDDSAMLLYSGF